MNSDFNRLISPHFRPSPMVAGGLINSVLPPGLSAYASVPLHPRANIVKPSTEPSMS